MLTKNIHEAQKLPLGNDVKMAFNVYFAKIDFDELMCSNVKIGSNGDAIVTFVDAHGTDLSVLFSYTEEEGAEAVIMDFDDISGDDVEFETIDLDQYDPSYRKTAMGLKFLNLIDLYWLPAQFFSLLFADGELDIDGDEMLEASIVVIRGGKRVRKKLVVRRRKRRVTGQLRVALRRAARKRKVKKHVIARKRKKSLKVRKRNKLKTNRNKNLKVAGTSTYRR